MGQTRAACHDGAAATVQERLGLLVVKMPALPEGSAMGDHIPVLEADYPVLVVVGANRLCRGKMSRRTLGHGALARARENMSGAPLPRSWCGENPSDQN